MHHTDLNSKALSSEHAASAVSSQAAPLEAWQRAQWSYVNVVVAELVSYAAAAAKPLYLGTVGLEAADVLDNLAAQLEEYGFTLRWRDRRCGDTVLVFMVPMVADVMPQVVVREVVAKQTCAA